MGRSATGLVCCSNQLFIEEAGCSFYDALCVIGKHQEKLQRKELQHDVSAASADALKENDKATIGSWDWKLKDKSCTYHDLFPRSWMVYDGEPKPEIKITCRQISPFLPHNYKESSFPVALFTSTVHNSGSTPADITLLFSLHMGFGGQSELTGNHTNSKMIERDGVHGVLLRHRTADGHPPVTFEITSQETENVRVTDCPFFTMGSSNSSEFTAKNMWEEIKKHGSFSKASTDKETRVSKPGSSIGAAVAATMVPAGETRVVSFALSWSLPRGEVPRRKTYHRYTKFYGFDQDEAAENLAHDALLGNIC